MIIPYKQHSTTNNNYMREYMLCVFVYIYGVCSYIHKSVRLRRYDMRMLDDDNDDDGWSRESRSNYKLHWQLFSWYAPLRRANLSCGAISGIYAWSDYGFVSTSPNSMDHCVHVDTRMDECARECEHNMHMRRLSVSDKQRWRTRSVDGGEYVCSCVVGCTSMLA